MLGIIKVAYVGDFINHGKSLPTAGTSLVIMLSKITGVELVDVYCPSLNESTEQFEPPNNVKTKEYYNYNNPFSVLRLLKVEWKEYNMILFNLLPTAFGDSSLSNVIGLLLPLILSKLGRVKGVKVIYHNSVYTNDVVKLGYDSTWDQVRGFFLGLVERALFKNIDSYVLLKLYKSRIDEAIGKNRVRYLNLRYLEAITTVYLNSAMDAEVLAKKQNEVPVVLMHGAWGPQKNIELGLCALKEIKDAGGKFRLVISGGINYHFPEYEKYFKETLKKYADLGYNLIGPLPEKKIMDIFLEADLLILPYNTPGGHSGVLEQAIFFDVPTIAISFPEYVEQTSGLNNVHLAEQNDFKFIVKSMISKIATNTKVNITGKIINSLRNINVLIDD